MATIKNMASKISDIEYQVLQELRQRGIEYASRLGELNYQKVSIELQLDEEKQKIKKLKKDEEVYFSGLREAYGNISVNLETGAITPQDL